MGKAKQHSCDQDRYRHAQYRTEATHLSDESAQQESSKKKFLDERATETDQQPENDQSAIAADAAEMLRSGKADAFGADSGVGFPAAEALPGAKIVPGAFAMVRVAAALPRGRSTVAKAALAALVDEAKQSGVVQKAIDAKGLKGVNVAPN